MRSNYSDIAQSILTTVQSHALPEHDYALATASAFRHLNLGFYAKTQGSLETLGFRLVADVENRTISTDRASNRPVGLGSKVGCGFHEGQA